MEFVNYDAILSDIPDSIEKIKEDNCNVSVAETESKLEAETGTEPETETKSETGKKSETETKSETGTEPETETKSETGTEPETETKSETGTEIQNENTNTSENQEEKFIFNDIESFLKNKGYSTDNVGGLIIAGASFYKLEGNKLITYASDGTLIRTETLTKTEPFFTTQIDELGKIDFSKFQSETISVDDIEKVRDKTKEFLEYFDDTILKELKVTFFENFSNLNQKTGEELKKKNIDANYIDNLFNNFFTDFQDTTGAIITELIGIINSCIATNEDNTSDADPEEPATISTSSRGSSSSHTSSADTSTIDDTTVIDQETLTKLMPAVTGMITFNEIVSMFETIGGTSIQSSTTGQYGLIGVVQENGKYYYKILDTKTGKVYYTEITEKSKITWGENGEKKVVEVNDDNAMILKQTGESEDGFVRFADKGDVYLLADDKTTVDEIDYYSIMDSKTDSKLFMVSSSSVSEPKTISDLISAVDEEVIK